jgi:hypothetical protein
VVVVVVVVRGDEHNNRGISRQRQARTSAEPEVMLVSGDVILCDRVVRCPGTYTRYHQQRTLYLSFR